jgi:hypothetical protein
MMSYLRTALTVTAALLVGAAMASTPWAGATATPARFGSAPVIPAAAGPGGLDPADFTAPRANPYFPLEPGTVSRYRGTEAGKVFRERLAVTDRGRTILGVRATVVTDVLRLADGTLAERTTDWYAPDNLGNVWYLGERTATYKPNGDLDSRDGTWLAGEDGAVAGLIMPADPGPTDAYRQELRRGHAEDQAWIVQRRHGTVRLPYGRVDGALRSFEWTRLEPGVVSMKIYGKGLGIVREKDVAGGDEQFDLVSVTHR